MFDVVTRPLPLSPDADESTEEPLVDTDLFADCGENPTWLCEQVYDLTGGNGFIASIVDAVVIVALILLVAWIIVRIVKRYLRRAIQRMIATDRTATQKRLKRLGLDSDGEEDLLGTSPDAASRREARATSISFVVGGTVSVAVWTMAAIIALGELGLNLGPLIAGAGIAGVALGFGAQSLVKDCIAGLFVLLEDQYGIGDVVDLGEAIGVVERISLRVTVLRSLNGTVWHVPNGEVVRVGNLSQLWSAALVDVDVAYDSDVERAGTILLEAAQELCAREEWASLIVEEPQLLGVEALGADGVTLRIVVKTRPGEQWGLQRALRLHFKQVFDDAGIEIPFPQRTVWMRQDA